MKKRIISIVCSIIATILFCALIGTGCQKQKLVMGKEYVPYTSQLDATRAVVEGNVDACVIDSVMAGYYCTTGEYADDITIVSNLIFAQEQYGVAGKKGNKALMSKVNEALIAISETDCVSVATKWGLQNELLINTQTANPYEDATDNSWNSLVSRGKIVIGYTIFAPIAVDENNGFDIELANKVVTYLNNKYGVNLIVEFSVISWDAKEALLNNGGIDLVWNGLTITSERQANMCISIPYLANNQVAVVRKADVSKYTDKNSFSKAIMAAERGSAGETVIKGEEKIDSIFVELLKGFGVTLSLFATTLIVGIPLGLLISLCTMSKFKPLKYLFKCIIWIIRSTPLLLQVLLITFIPNALFKVQLTELSVKLNTTVANLNFIFVCVAFVINYACYFSEIFRAGIESIPKGQYEAGKVLGMSKAQIFFKVVSMQVVKRIVPPMSNEIITLVKDTSIAAIIGIQDLMTIAKNIQNKLAIGLTPLLYAGLFYLIFNGILTLLFGYIEKKLSYYKV